MRVDEEYIGECRNENKMSKYHHDDGSNLNHGRRHILFQVH